MSDDNPMLTRRKESPAGAGHWHITELYPHTIRVRIGDVVVAETDAALILKEVGRTVYNPSFYIPVRDTRMELVEKEDGFTTACPIKGEATYFHYAGNGERIEWAAWAYEDPLPYSDMLRGHVGFDQRWATLEIVARKA
ncbi:MAG: hypothetical protein COV99_05345 [Bacteroidetes bacterium CG12_big_fil_rev_8_21_14_0_65_60_17]|nr:MAG: hypothetical protein COV99_05345 [Bacteroidetes bacterium CG12_big_fil_rev_8_21_14_0_65_60_17]